MVHGLDDVKVRQRVERWAWVLALFAGLAVQQSAPGRLLDVKLLDRQFQLLRDLAPRPVDRDVVLVGIDDSTSKTFPEPLALWHRHLGTFLKAMAEARPAVVGFDYVLPDRSFDAVLPGADRALLEGILATRGKVPLVFGLTVDPQGEYRKVYAPFLSVAGRDSTGLVLLHPSPFTPVDEVVRYFDERLGADGSWQPTLAGQMARRMKREPGRGWIDFSRGTPIDYVPLQQVVAWYEQGELETLRARFGDRPVMVGSVFEFEDRHHQPVNLAAWETVEGNQRYTPGVLLHIQALRSMLSDGFIEDPPGWMTYLLVLLAALSWRLRWPAARASAGLAALAALLVTAGTVAVHQGLFLPVSGVLTAALLSLGGRLAWTAALQSAERRQLKDAFRGYVSPAIMDEILQGRLGGGLGGARHELCVLFADIRGFTSRTESLPPEAVIDLLNRYFEEVTGSIHEHGGTIDKFLGDGVMAFFGAPQKHPDPCGAAVGAARDLLARLEHLNQALAAEGIEPIRIGIGLHLGEAIVGHIGSRARHEYTAIGDTVNVGSRLEGLTKEVGYPLVASAAVVEALGDRTGFEALGARAIKGHAPVEVYGWRPPGPDNMGRNEE
jgi:adenylate cyclase